MFTLTIRRSSEVVNRLSPYGEEITIFPQLLIDKCVLFFLVFCGFVIRFIFHLLNSAYVDLNCFLIYQFLAISTEVKRWERTKEREKKDEREREKQRRKQRKNIFISASSHQFNADYYQFFNLMIVFQRRHLF